MLTSVLLAGTPHAFTGVAEGDLRRDQASRVAAVVRSLPGVERFATLAQVHSATVRFAEELAPDEVAEGDALLCTTPGLAVGVRVADCVPVLLVGPGIVGAVHAGWRGTAADIVRRAVALACERTGAAPEAFRAAVGPSIRGCCYEVGPEVIDAVGAVAPGQAWLEGRRVDLAEANLAILRAIGVEAEVVGGCTLCGEGHYSHRRGDAGRQLGFIVR